MFAPFPSPIDEIDVREPVLALTFDDGPSEWTDAILDLLDGRGLATFFVVGSAISGEQRKAKATLRRIVEVGCEIGNHTYSHPQLTTLPSPEE